jgi:hypothetical protein
MRLIQLIRRLERLAREHGDVDAPVNVRAEINIGGGRSEAYAQQDVTVSQRRDRSNDDR